MLRDGTRYDVRRCLTSRWLLIVDGGVALVLLGAVLAPLMSAAGLPNLSEAVHTAYLLLCPQRPDHSFFLLGQQLALEHREIGMLAGLLVGSATYRVRRFRDSPLPFWLLLAAGVPVLWDVLSQMAGLRVSDWPTRTWTGGLFTFTYVLWLYPAVDRLVRVRTSRAGAVG